ncbi:hypothetical protein ACFQ3R_00430 [Mesonia ostreae]|uniref:Uncharacterized protein n=1 Tax=Mesonia ostreae TaxID=861110 RepID=A0ABU2KJE8_9FLAO|nr:hypothetical protein [Mesonia ostreae]MDT0294842.1 hypothetical protein [Mesonia ostreae]
MKITKVELKYEKPTFPGGLSVDEMQNILMKMDWENGEEVEKETKRCNNRCNGNDTDLEVPVLRVETK